jgi:pectate lyase
VHGVDELISVKDAADYITISWCKFSFESEGDHNLAALIGSTDNWPMDEGHLNITWHHNWFADRVHGRMPRVRYGKNHVFNNYFAVPNHDGYCITANWDSQLLVENNYFYKVESPYNTADAGSGHPGRLKAVGNVLDQCFGSISSGNDTVFTPAYPYTLETPATARANTIAGAGNTF